MRFDDRYGDEDDFTDEEREESERRCIRAAVVGAVLAVVLMALVLVLTLLPRHAHGHDPYTWIMDNPKTAWCCGPDDCSPTETRKETITRDKDGHYFVSGHPIKDENVFQAHEHGKNRPWVCYGMAAEAEVDYDNPVCLFIPFAG